MRVPAIVAYALLMTLLASCIVTPKRIGVRGKITDSSLAFLQEGKTALKDVLMNLGLPDQADQQEKWVIYEWATAWDYHDYLTQSEMRNDHILLLEFNDQGIVSRVRRRKGDIDKMDRDFLSEGSTRVHDVLLHMGLPDECDEQGKRFAYTRPREFFYFWERLRRIIGDDELLQDLFLQEIKHQNMFMTSITIEFDDQGIVTSVNESGKVEIPSSEDLTWAEFDKLVCGEYGGKLSETNFYVNQQHGFSIQFPSEWQTGCKGGSEIIKAGKSVDTDFFSSLPYYYLNLWIEAHPTSDDSDIWDLASSSTPDTDRECPAHWICDKTIEVIDSEKTRLEGKYAARAVLRVKEIMQEREFYQLYKLGPRRFGNQLLDIEAMNTQQQLLTYWFLRNDKVYQVTGEVSAWGETQEKFERAANKWKQVIEKSIRSFRFIN